MAAMKAVQSSMNDRIRAAIGAAALQGLFGYALITQLAVEMPVAASDALKLFEVLPKTPPRIEKITPPRVGSNKPKNAASPPNLKAKQTAIIHDRTHQQKGKETKE